MKGAAMMKEPVNERKDISDVVISTRIRFARNLRDYPFPGRLSEDSKIQIYPDVGAYSRGGSITC